MWRCDDAIMKRQSVQQQPHPACAVVTSTLLVLTLVLAPRSPLCHRASVVLLEVQREATRLLIGLGSKAECSAPARKGACQLGHLVFVDAD
jgi:hypothetical protein